MVVDHHLARRTLTHPALVKDPTPAIATRQAVGYSSHRTDTGLSGHRQRRTIPVILLTPALTAPG